MALVMVFFTSFIFLCKFKWNQLQLVVVNTEVRHCSTWANPLKWKLCIEKLISLEIVATGIVISWPRSVAGFSMSGYKRFYTLKTTKLLILYSTSCGLKMMVVIRIHTILAVHLLFPLQVDICKQSHAASKTFL